MAHPAVMFEIMAHDQDALILRASDDRAALEADTAARSHEVKLWMVHCWVEQGGGSRTARGSRCVSCCSRRGSTSWRFSKKVPPRTISSTQRAGAAGVTSGSGKHFTRANHVPRLSDLGSG